MEKNNAILFVINKRKCHIYRVVWFALLTLKLIKTSNNSDNFLNVFAVTETMIVKDKFSVRKK